MHRSVSSFAAGKGSLQQRRVEDHLLSPSCQSFLNPVPQPAQQGAISRTSLAVCICVVCAEKHINQGLCLNRVWPIVSFLPSQHARHPMCRRVGLATEAQCHDSQRQCVSGVSGVFTYCGGHAPPHPRTPPPGQMTVSCLILPGFIFLLHSWSWHCL